MRRSNYLIIFMMSAICALAAPLAAQESTGDIEPEAMAVLNRNTNVNRNTNINRNTNVNVNRDVNVNVHGAATAMVTAAVIGSVVNTIPPSCSMVVVNGITYQQCGGTWYQLQFVGTTASYVVVRLRVSYCAKY